MGYKPFVIWQYPFSYYTKKANVKKAIQICILCCFLFLQNFARHMVQNFILYIYADITMYTWKGRSIYIYHNLPKIELHYILHFEQTP